MAVLHRSHVFSMLLAALIFGAAMPCEVLEAAGVAVCVEDVTDCTPESASGSEEETCCAVCLTCCAVSLQPAATSHFSSTGAVSALVPNEEERVHASHIPVWHPPRP